MNTIKRSKGGLMDLIGNPEVKAKKRIPFRLSAAMKQRFLLAVVDQGYGLKGKSRFVQDAVIELLKSPMWVSTILDSEAYSTAQASEMDDVYLDSNLVNEMELSGLQLRSAGLKEKPPIIFKGIAAPVIRAAILKKISQD